MNRLLRAFGVRTGGIPKARRPTAAGRVAAAVVLAMAVGCERRPGATTASPRAAAKAFAEAMTTGDRQAVRRVSVGDDASLELLVAAAASNAAYDRLEQAAAGRFGDAKQVTVGGRGADHYAKLLAGIDAAPEVVQGEQATVGVGRAKLFLRRVEAAWRVDRAMHVPPAGSDSATHLAMTRAMTRAYDEVTNGMASGAYGTAEAAKAALIGRTMEAVLSQQPTPTTGRAVAPANEAPARTKPS